MMQANGPTPRLRLAVGLLLLAGINAIAFHTGPYQSVARWDTQQTAPFLARVSVAASLLIWAAVITSGRFLAYT